MADLDAVLRANDGLSAALRKERAEIERLRSALKSIAANTCCDACQEAALVARAALGITSVGRADQLQG